MGFWIFMVWMNALIPILMILFGHILWKYPPKDINAVYGYRTSRSRASQEAWLFAQTYFGKIWFYEGIGLLVVSVVGMLPLLGGQVEEIGKGGGILCGVQVVLLLIPIIPTERALKKKFGDQKKH